MTADPAEQSRSLQKAFVSVVADALRKGGLTVTVGAGLSVAAGLPSWAGLAAVLTEQLRPGYEEPLPEDPLRVAELYKHAFGVHRLRQVVCDTFRGVTEPSPGHLALAELGPSVHYFTTNYDLLLEIALRRVLGAAAVQVLLDDVEVDFLSPDLIPVYKLAGSADHPGSLLVARSDYLIHRQTHPRVISRFIDELRSRTTVFVGSGLLDPTIEYCLGEAFGQTMGHGRRAFVVLDEASRADRDYLESVGLQPVLLGDYAVLPGLLAEAKQAASMAPASASITARVSELGAPGETVERVYAAASGALADQLRDIRQRVDLGAGPAASAEIDSLLERLQELPLGTRGALEAQAALIGARVTIREGGEDQAKVESYLHRAKSAGIAELKDEYQIVTAMALHASGQTDAALSALAEVSSDWAVRTKFAISLAAGRIAACRQILDELGPDAKAFDTESGHRLVALLCIHEGRFAEAVSEAQRALARGRRGPDQRSSAPALEAAGVACGALAGQRLRGLMERHHLVPELFIEIDLRPLVDRELELQAADYFDQAAAVFESLHNLEDAIRCYLEAYTLLARDASEKERESSLAATLRGLAPCSLIHDLAAQQSDTDALGELHELGLDARLEDELLGVVLADEDQDRLREQLARSVLLAEESVPVRLSAVGTLFEILDRRGDAEGAVDLAVTTVLPREYAYLQQLFIYLVGQIRRDRQLSGTALRAALALAPRNPSVLLVALRRGASLLRENGEAEWKEWCWQLAVVLVEELPTVEAYEQLSYWGLQAGRYQEVLAAIESPEADATLSRWQVQVSRGEALALLGRAVEAREALAEALREEPPSKPLAPPFFVELTRLYVETGQYQRAVAVAAEARGRFPDEISVLMAEVAAYEQSGDLENAYLCAKDAALRFSDSEHVQARWIQLGFSTAHAAEVTEALTRFIARWPESRFWRRYDLQGALRLIRTMQERAEQLFTLYKQGALPALALCHAAPGALAYFQFSGDRWNAKVPLFATRGRDAGLADRWASQEHSPAFVVDYTAALTLWRLFGDGWPDRLNGLEWRLVDTTLLLNAERQKLSAWQPDQHQRRIEQAADWIEQGLIRGYLHQIPGDGEADEVRFALEQGGRARLTLEEADVPSNSSFGLGDLAILLQAAGVASEEQTKLLSRYGRRIASDAALEAVRAGREFVVDDQVLDSTVELGELGWLVDFARRIWISKQSIERARAMRVQVSRLRELVDDFEAFRRSIEAAQRHAPDRVSLCDRRPDEMDRPIVFVYLRSLIETCQATRRGLLVDDHFFDRGIEGTGEQSFSTPTLLRLMFLRGALAEQEYCRYIDQLVTHGYRWMPPEAEHVYHLLSLNTDDPARQSALDVTRDYLRGAMGAANRPDLPPAIRQQARSAVFRYAGEVLCDTVFRACASGVQEARVAAFLQDWAPDRVLLGSGLQGTAFITLLANRCFQMPQGNTRTTVAAWLDRVLLGSSYTEADIDMTWASLVRQMLRFGPGNVPAEAVYLMAVELLNDLPERTRVSVYHSAAGDQLRAQFGEPDTVTQVMRMDEGGERAVLRIAEREMHEYADRLLVALTEGQSEIKARNGLVLRFEEASSPSLFVPIRSYLRASGQDQHVPGLDRWTDWYRQLASETGAVRGYAWQHILGAARSLGVPPASFPALAEELLVSGEAGERAGRQAQTFVRRTLPLFAELLGRYAEYGHLDGVEGLLSALELDDASAWVSASRGAVRGGALARAVGAVARAFREVPPTLDLRGADRLLGLSREFGGSLFSDGAAFASGTAETIAAMGPADRATGADPEAAGLPPRARAQFAADWLYLVRENLPTQRVWLNCVLAAVRVAASAGLWQEKVADPTSSDVRPLVTLLHDMLSDAVQYRRSESPQPLLEVSITARRLECLLGLNWLADGGDAEVCRYVAALSGELLALSLAAVWSRRRTSEGDRGPHDAVWSALAAQSREALFRQVAQHHASASARYRSEWAAFIPFELEYLGKQADPDQLRALMSDGLRRSLLEWGIAHKCVCDLLGAPDAAAPLDRELSPAPDGGMIALLASGGEPKRWLAEDQQRLAVLSADLSSEWFIDLWRDKGAHDDPELIRFLNVLMYGATSAGETWLARARSLLDPVVQARASENAQLLQMIAAIAALAVLAKPSRSGRLLRWLTPPASSLTEATAPELALAVGYLVWANAQAVRPSRATEERCRKWVCGVLTERQVEASIKRRVLQTIGNVWEHLPEAFRVEVRRAMDELRADPSVRTWLEWEHYGFLPRGEARTNGED